MIHRARALTVNPHSAELFPAAAPEQRPTNREKLAQIAALVALWQAPRRA